MEVNQENYVKNLEKVAWGVMGDRRRTLNQTGESLVSSQRPQCLVLKDEQDK